ncbi:MAG: thioredoxin family protein [Gillisia sp.]|nr:thioredoxin family protein [Gillisia sp.]
MSLYILILAFITSCGNINNTVKTADKDSTPVTVQNSEEQQGMLIGKFTKEDLQKPAYESWFKSGYDNFKPSAEAMETIKNNISDYEIMVFMGTWCGDSKREVPKLLKILDKAGYDLSNLTLVGVSRSKTTPEKLEVGWDINRVPSIIFIKDGKEINRFVEYPSETIEEDIAKIVSEQGYKHSYLN